MQRSIARMVHILCHFCGMDAPRRILSFLGLSFGITWTIAGVGALFKVNVDHPAYMVLAAACMLGPALAALIQWRLIDRAPWSAVGLHPRRIHWPGMGVTVLLGIAIVPLVLLMIAILGDGAGWAGFGHAEVSGARFATSLAEILKSRGLTDGGAMAAEMANLPGAAIMGLLLVSAVFAAFTVNLPFMLGEELGWRGYLYTATASWSPARRIVLTGPIWGIWHAPLIAMGHNYPGHPVAGIGMMVLFCTLLAVLFDQVRTRVGSVWGACVLHGIINGSAGAFALFAWDGHVMIASPAGVAGCLAIALLAAVVLLMDGDYRRSFFKPVVLPATIPDLP